LLAALRVASCCACVPSLRPRPAASRGGRFAAAIEKWIVADNKRACAHLGAQQNTHCDQNALRVAAATGQRKPCSADSRVYKFLYRSPRRASSTLLNDSSATTRPAFSAFFHSAHSAFSFRANAEPNTADHHTDTRRRWPFLNDPASLRGRLLNDVIVGKARGNDESRQSDTGQKLLAWEVSLQLEMTSFNSRESAGVPEQSPTMERRETCAERGRPQGCTA